MSLSLHLSRYHIVGNHMTQLIWFSTSNKNFGYQKFSLLNCKFLPMNFYHRYISVPTTYVLVEKRTAFFCCTLLTKLPDWKSQLFFLLLLLS